MNGFGGIAGGKGIKSYQTGYVSQANITPGSAGEDLTVIDVTISAVNTEKTVCFFNGVSGAALSTATVSNVTARLTSSTNLRIACTYGDSIYGRWQAVEFE